MEGAIEYFPPEVFVYTGVGYTYNKPIDIFCLGCIMCHLFSTQKIRHVRYITQDTLEGLEGGLDIDMRKLSPSIDRTIVVRQYLMAHLSQITGIEGREIPQHLREIPHGLPTVACTKMLGDLCMSRRVDRPLLGAAPSDPPRQLYDLMFNCLNINPDERISAADLCKELDIDDTWECKEKSEDFRHNMEQLNDLKNVVINLQDSYHYNGQLLLNDTGTYTCCDDG